MALTPSRLLAVVVVLTALVYLPVLRSEFVYDDQGIIIENPTIRAWHYVPQYFREQLWHYWFPNAPSNYYRPLNVVLFRVNYALFGVQPIGWHAYTLLLHLIATALVFCIVRRVTDCPWVAAVSSLLFGVHPLHHEVVAWVSGTTESLCAVFFLATFLAYLKSRERGTVGWIIVSCICYAGALLSKETGVVVPGLVFAHACLYGVRSSDDYSLSWTGIFRAVLRASVYVPVCLAYIVTRAVVLNGLVHSGNVLVLSTLLLTLPSVLLFYLRQGLVPIQFAEFYDLPVRTHWDFPHVGLPLMILAAASALLWWFRKRLGPRELTFAVIAMTLPLLPAMNLSVFSAGELVHDRYAYLPSFGAALIAGLALQPLTRSRLVFGMPQRLVLAMLLIILPLSYSTANAASYWQNNFDLFKHAYQVAPQNSTARLNYALELSRLGDKGTAIAMLTDLVKDHPESFYANFDLGCLLYEVNLLPAAEHYQRIAQRLDPGQEAPYFQLALIYLRQGRSKDSLDLFRHAVSIRPDNPKLHFALGVAIANGGDCPGARKEFGEAFQLDPTLTAATQQMDKCTADANTFVEAPVRPLIRTVQVPLLPVKER